MKIKTKAYGQVDINEKQVIFFPAGIFGFETLREFALLDAEQKPFFGSNHWKLNKLRLF